MQHDYEEGNETPPMGSITIPELASPQDFTSYTYPKQQEQATQSMQGRDNARDDNNVRVKLKDLQSTMTSKEEQTDDPLGINRDEFYRGNTRPDTQDEFQFDINLGDIQTNPTSGIGTMNSLPQQYNPILDQVQDQAFDKNEDFTFTNQPAYADEKIRLTKLPPNP